MPSRRSASGPRADLRRFAAAICATAALAGCGGGGNPPTADFTPEEQALLPENDRTLVDHSCPNEFPAAIARKFRRQGRSEFRALARAYRADPDALVRTTDYPEAGGTTYPIVTVRQLYEDSVDITRLFLRTGGPEVKAGTPYGTCLRLHLGSLEALRPYP